MKTKKAIQAAQLDAETERTLTEITGQRVAAKVEITWNDLKIQYHPHESL